MAQTSPHVLLSGLDNARSVRISTLGNLFVVESGRNRVLKIAQNGERLDSLGRLGRGDYQFDSPVAVDPTNELKIYVSDRNNRRIQVFDRRLQYLATISLPSRTAGSTTYRPSLLSVDRSGRAWFFDEEQSLIYRFDSSGRFDLTFELYSEEERIRPMTMDIADDMLWVAGGRGDLLHRFSSGGTYIGFLHTPEPVRSLRIIGDDVWLLGTEHVMRIDRTGEVTWRMPLPETEVATRHRRFSRRQTDTDWHSFDIKNGSVFLLNAHRLVRVDIGREASREE